MVKLAWFKEKFCNVVVSENIIRSFLIIVIGAAKPPIHGNYFTQ